MLTKPAKMYNRVMYENRTPSQIVSTIKAQLWANGKSGRCIKVNDDGDIEIKTSDFVGIVYNNEQNLIYFDNKSMAIFVICEKMGYSIKV